LEAVRNQKKWITMEHPHEIAYNQVHGLVKQLMDRSKSNKVDLTSLFKFMAPKVA